MKKNLTLLLRIIGGFSLLAVIFIFAPYNWMDALHTALGMGKLPETPVVGYLARSTSAFYALLGALLWFVSFDLWRYRALLIFLGYAIAVFGLALTYIDWLENMPIYWKIWEGPFVIVLGLVVLFLSRGIIDKKSS